MKKAFGFIILLISFILLGKTATSVLACDDGGWSPWKNTSTCVATTCGTRNGTKTQERKQSKEVCDKDCPTYTFSTYRFVCPEEDSAYTSNDSHKACKRKINGHAKYASKEKETFSVNFKYEKSSDQNKCHKPTPQSLNIVSWARDEYGKEFDEFENEININCRQEIVDSETRTVNCNNAVVIACTTPTATPTPTSTLTPTPTSTPMPTETEIPHETGTLTPTPTATTTPVPTETETPDSGETGTPTPTPITVVDQPRGGQDDPGAPVCNDAVPSTTSILSVIPLNGNSVKVIWQKVTSANDYALLYGPTTGNYPYSVFSTGNTDNFTISGISKGCFVVKTINGCQPGAVSTEFCTGNVGGNVLGASTLGATGNVLNSFSNILLGIGSLLSLLGIKKNSVKK